MLLSVLYVYLRGWIHIQKKIIKQQSKMKKNDVNYKVKT